MIWLLLIFLIVAVDQITKFLINKSIILYGLHVVINNLLYLTHYENNGVAFSLLQNKRLIFIPISIAVLLVMGYFFTKSRNKLCKISLLFITSGATGNLIDRILKGSVTDFIEIHLGSIALPILNIADLFIISGTILLAYYLLFESNKIPVRYL